MATGAREIETEETQLLATAMEKKTVILRTKDAKEFQVEWPVAEQFEAIKSLFNDMTLPVVPVPKVDGNTLTKVIEYCTRHADQGALKARYKGKAKAKAGDQPLEIWDAEFVKLGPDDLYDLVTAAHYLGVRGLVELCAQAVADMIQGKTPEEIRTLLNIKNDLEPEEGGRCFCL